MTLSWNGEILYRYLVIPGEARFGLGVTTLYYQDPETDELSPFSRKHVETCVRLGNTLASFDFVATPGILREFLVIGSDVEELQASVF